MFQSVAMIRMAAMYNFFSILKSMSPSQARHIAGNDSKFLAHLAF